MNDDRIARRLDENDLQWFITRTDAQSQAVLFSYLSRAVAEIRTCWATIAALSGEKDEWKLKHECSEGVLSMTVHRLEGIVEGNPTGRHNFLQRIDELRAKEAALAAASTRLDHLEGEKQIYEEGLQLWDAQEQGFNAQIAVLSAEKEQALGWLSETHERVKKALADEYDAHGLDVYIGDAHAGHVAEVVAQRLRGYKNVIAALEADPLRAELATLRDETDAFRAREIALRQQLEIQSTSLAEVEQENKALLEEHRNIAEPGRAARNLTRLMQAMGMCDTCAAPLVEDDEPCIRCAKCEKALVDAAAILRAELEDLNTKQGRCREKADLLIDPLRARCRALGYALAVHGSQSRDIDLVAVAWTEEAVSASALAAALIATIDQLNGVAIVVNDENAGPLEYTRRCPEPKPHGRIGWSIHLGGGPYIDLSIMPPADPTPDWWTLKIAELQRQKSQLEDSVLGVVTERNQANGAAATLRAALEQLLAYPQGMMIPGHDDKGYVLLSWVHSKAKDALAAITL